MFSPLSLLSAEVTSSSSSESVANSGMPSCNWRQDSQIRTWRLRMSLCHKGRQTSQNVALHVSHARISSLQSLCGHLGPAGVLSTASPRGTTVISTMSSQSSSSSCSSSPSSSPLLSALCIVAVCVATKQFCHSQRGVAAVAAAIGDGERL